MDGLASLCLAQVGYVLEFATQEHLEFYLNECPGV